MEEGANRNKVCWQIYHPDRGQNFHRTGIRLRFPGDDCQVVIRPSDRAHYSFYGDTLVSDRGRASRASVKSLNISGCWPITVITLVL
jgi:hypothetical protein